MCVRTCVDTSGSRVVVVFNEMVCRRERWTANVSPARIQHGGRGERRARAHAYIIMYGDMRFKDDDDVVSFHQSSPARALKFNITVSQSFDRCACACATDW